MTNASPAEANNERVRRRRVFIHDEAVQRASWRNATHSLPLL